MIMNILGLLLKLKPKTALIALSVAGVLYGGYHYGDLMYDRGVSEQKAAMDKAVAEAVALTEKEYQKALMLQAEKASIAERDLMLLRQAPKEVEIREVVKVLEGSDCTVTPEFSRLLNSTIGNKPVVQNAR